MGHADIEELKSEVICADCVGEAYLSKIIANEGEERVCRYCEETGASFTLEEIADSIESAFEEHYSITATDPDAFEWAMHSDPESKYSWEREGEKTVYAIMNAADISEEAAGDIQSILADRHGDYESAKMGEETPFDEDAHYEQVLPTDADWQESWRTFEKTLKTEARFFSRIATEKLSALFDDIDKMRTRDGVSLIVEAGPETSHPHFFRARVFQSSQKLAKALERPDRELAAPPSLIAAAGRMNAKGISAFYGATEAKIALAEVRPPVGSEVAIARFEVTRPLHLLNLNALADIHESGSIFEPSYAGRLSRMRFLRNFCDRMSRPVMPDDQDFEYLPTQAIADYLATESKVPLDGILFPSVQADGGGLNVVLFHKASRCAEIDMPPGTGIEVSIGRQHHEGWDRDYTVWETVPPEKEAPVEEKSHPFFDVPAVFIDWENGDYRDATLKIDVESINVHYVAAVEFKAETHRVTRYRDTKKEAPF